MTSTVPPGDYPSVSWINEVDVPLADNDGGGSQYELIVTNDRSGGTGNSVGLTMRQF
jgi:hypothetical protein